jgi:hypothetical protein
MQINHLTTNLSQKQYETVPRKTSKKTSETIPKRGLKWITPTVREKIQLRRKAERRYKQTPNTENMLEYKKIKGQTRRVMNIAKREAREQFVSNITAETPSQ